MSKNFVREINNIKNINEQEFYTNKANDLLSTKDHNYIRKQKREYHCLTDNVKATRAKNVTYNGKQLITIDNSDVPTTNENTLNGQHLVSVINEMANEIETLKNESPSVNEKQPRFHYVAEFAGEQFFNMQTTQTYNFDAIEIFTRVAYSLTIDNATRTRNFADVLKSGAKNFTFDDYNITIKNYYKICGDDGIVVSIDDAQTGLDFAPLREQEGLFRGEIFIKFRLTKKQETEVN